MKNPSSVFVNPEQPQPFEQVAQMILQLLPEAKIERSSNWIQLQYRDFRDPQGLVVVVTPQVLELRSPTIKWVNSYTPEDSTKLLQQLQLETLSLDQLPVLITTAQAQHGATFKTCSFCQQQTPNGWMYDSTVCQSCAEEELGVLY